MPNGFHGSKARWRELEAPLRALDARLGRYAATHDLTLETNRRGWPDRSLVWETGGVWRKLQIYLDGATPASYRVWLVAWRDRDGGRRLKRAVLAEALSPEELDARLLELLDRGRERLAGWTEAELEPVPG